MDLTPIPGPWFPLQWCAPDDDNDNCSDTDDDEETQTTQLKRAHRDRRSKRHNTLCENLAAFAGANEILYRFLNELPIPDELLLRAIISSEQFLSAVERVISHWPSNSRVLMHRIADAWGKNGRISCFEWKGDMFYRLRGCLPSTDRAFTDQLALELMATARVDVNQVMEDLEFNWQRSRPKYYKAPITFNVVGLQARVQMVRMGADLWKVVGGRTPLTTTRELRNRELIKRRVGWPNGPSREDMDDTARAFNFMAHYMYTGLLLCVHHPSQPQSPLRVLPAELIARIVDKFCYTAESVPMRRHYDGTNWAWGPYTL